MEAEDQTLIVELLAVRKVVDHVKPPVPEPITLNLPYWTAIRTASAAPEDLILVKEVLQFFANAARRNGLDGTTAATKLSQAISVMEGVTSAMMVDQIPQADRVSHGQTSLSLATTWDLQLELASESDLTIALQQLARGAVFHVPSSTSGTPSP